VDDPQGLTATIFEATRLAGVRAIISQGWGDLGEMVKSPPNVFLIGECPHDWLFKHVSCVVHHGGAGTTAAGIAAGKPTVVVPFFGDQQFWGDVVAQAGAGPRPISHRLLSTSSLADAIMVALDPTMSASAHSLAAKISEEHGSERAATSFHEQLPLHSMRCCVNPKKAAVWWDGRKELKFSALVATVLSRRGLIDLDHLQLSVSQNSRLGLSLIRTDIAHVNTNSITVLGSQCREAS
jgi:UDP-glucoronosyl and UDP-glucosyl transferase